MFFLITSGVAIAVAIIDYRLKLPVWLGFGLACAITMIPSFLLRWLEVGTPRPSDALFWIPMEAMIMAAFMAVPYFATCWLLRYRRVPPRIPFKE